MSNNPTDVLIRAVVADRHPHAGASFTLKVARDGGQQGVRERVRAIGLECFRDAGVPLASPDCADFELLLGKTVNGQERREALLYTLRNLLIDVEESATGINAAVKARVHEALEELDRELGLETLGL